MASDPHISVIVTTYQRPEHLRRSLFSLSLQQDVPEPFEVVVTDDGSTDSTAQVVERFARSVDFPVRFVTQPHQGFHPARCRNNGALASRGEYLIFFDGDCVFPRDHLQQHLRARRPSLVRTGDSYRLDRQSFDQTDDAAIVYGDFTRLVSSTERRRMQVRWFREIFYSSIDHASKPKLMSGNLAVWRSDFERINGFDEQFVGWGCEDDDLGHRLRQTGVRVAPIYGYTQAYHLWHPPHESRPKRWRDGVNVAYLMRQDKPTRCEVGLSSHVECIRFSVTDENGAGHPSDDRTMAA